MENVENQINMVVERGCASFSEIKKQLYEHEESDELNLYLKTIEDQIQKVVDSVVIQQGVEVEIFVVDDGSRIPVQVQKHSKVQLLRLDQNYGKRFAQIHAIHQASHDWIATVDSDTILDPHALYELHQAAVGNGWKSATGHVKLLNEKTNILTRMISCLYWYGFCQERACQSYFDSVTCCSGALSIWSKQTILESADLYLNQKFMGRDCVAGDDRYLTCIFALKGEKIGFALKSLAYTISPSTLTGFVRQQLRWTRSNIPALLFALKNAGLISSTFITFMLAVVFRYSYFAILYICVLWLLLVGNVVAPLMILFIILLVSGIKAANAFLYCREWKMFYLMPLSVLSFFVLSPVVIYGIMTPSAMGWLTRSKKGII